MLRCRGRLRGPLRSQLKFAARLEALRKAQFEQAQHNLQTINSEAVETLRRNLACGTPAVELAAAVRVIELGMKIAAGAAVNARKSPQLRDAPPAKPVREKVWE